MGRLRNRAQRRRIRCRRYARAAYILANDDLRNAVETAAPQPFGGFPGRPEWVAELICWLASADNRFVTGQIVFADGGSETTAIGDLHWR
ncbi:SDR family oxidoreductase [Nocardia sp. NPDC049707]|uniref:SDR family oxidoreductase n=1 Tax=Nocardia sp. NPDC049707 TaxID=3154735 RepID=UPI003449322B